MSAPIELGDLAIGMHVMYRFRLDSGIELTHGATVEEIPPWTDQSGEEHDSILLRRPDERVVRVWTR
jgi:hypothetical protein